MTAIEAEVEDEEEDEDRRDRPDLAFLQDFNRTRDPATGTVPRERLLVAQQRAEELLTLQASQRASVGTLSSATWTERGPSNVGGRVRAILIDPADASGNTVWVGSVAGGLWKSTNATSATPIWISVDGFMANLAITSLAYDPTNPDIMYMGTGEGFYNADAVRGLGIWKSTDHGATWNQLASTAPPASADFYRVQRLAVQQGTGYVFVATRTGLFRSKDKGATWQAVLQPAGIRMADVKISANGTIFVGAGIFQTGGLYRSTDNGDTWTNLNTLAGTGLPAPSVGYHRIELACAPSDANRVYAIFTSSTDILLNIYMSKDGGNTWATIRKPGGGDFTNGQGWYCLAIGVSPTSPNTLYVGGLDLWLTNNADAPQTAVPTSGATWTQTTVWSTSKTATNYVHADHHAVAWIPPTSGTATKAYFASDGGIAYSANANATTPTYGQRNNGLNITQFYALALHPSDVDYFLAGAQDNGTQRYTKAGGQVTTEATGGDGAFCFIDQNEPQFQFTAYVYAQYRRSTNGGSSFSTLNLSAANGQFINPTDYDSRSNTLYGGWTVDNFFRLRSATTAAASAVSGASLGAGAGMVTHLTVSPNNQDRVFIGTEPDFAGGTSTQGHLYRVDNAAATTPTVTLLYTAPAGMSISSVAVETGNDAHLLVTLSNFSATEAKVLETTDGLNTTDPVVWTKRQGDLPDMPVRWAVFDPTNNKRALLATELGIWSTDDLTPANPVWKPSSTGLANVRVDMLRIRASDQQVVAATHGRGLFVSDVLKDQPMPVELTSFTGQATEQGVALRWQTASEQNALHFDVERAAKGQSFQLLTKVAAAGNSTSLRNYTHTDVTVGSGLYYYRLRQVDQDGTVAYSPVVTVTIKPSMAPLLTSVYPNPFVDQLTLQLREPMSGNIVTTLTDLQGRTVYTYTTQSVSRLLPVPVSTSLAPGHYVLTVRAQGQKAVRRVIHR
ncbi:T9SS type A sorting domain-containing protein [Hymenobacter metallicola]|uniref:T9SS type A sorting domain-containing protein n=1 Tax=Hymenobacter metallicola TaxID=2563114 RepID=A0A4Z0QBF2_9BACT|nr:T9SS type A sorting domain-containing protein [Hymenobacter metallicola]TGE26483.1 T9SS type A sorting domain-containing protein [Hymenobacter metallicola]